MMEKHTESGKRLKPADIMQLQEMNFVMFSRDWFLLTAGDHASFNMMTCSWGGLGYLWNHPVSFVFVRPQRYTFEFIERHDRFSICVFDETHRSALEFCGTRSGRDQDKVAKTGLTPAFNESGVVYFDEARMVMICRKLYVRRLQEEGFLDKKLMETVYRTGDYHYMYIGTVEKLLTAGQVPERA